MTEQPVPDQLTAYPLTRHDEISPGVYVIGFERRFDFTPGQAVKLTLAPDIPPRIYSICSGIKDEEVCILFNVKEDGLLTPALARVQCGDILLSSRPYGSFICPDATAWWIAAGTGIAPFRSMVRSGMNAGKTLIHGVRHLNQFYFEDEFHEALGDKYHRCCSGATAPGVQSGRVTAFLAEQASLPSEIRYYICGQAAMAVDTRDALISRGIPFTHIATEIYF